MQEGGWSLMISTLKPTAEQRPLAAGVDVSAASMTTSTASVGPEGRSEGVEFAIGALVGLLVVLALAVWAYLILSDGDYSGVVDLTRSLAP
jgi:hypothetical protein